MGSPSKSEKFGLKKSPENNPHHPPNKRIKSDCSILNTSFNYFKVEDVKPLSIEEIRRNLQSPDVAVNILTLNHVKELCKHTISCNNSFLLTNEFVNEVIDLSIVKNQEDFYLASIDLMAEVVKKENARLNVNILIPYLVMFLQSSKSDLCQGAIHSLRNIESFTILSANIFTMCRGIKYLLKDNSNNHNEINASRDITNILLKVLKVHPPLTDEDVQILLNVCQKLLFHPNEDILGSVCSILDQLTNSFTGPFDEILETNIISSVAEHLNDWNLRVSMKALSVISNYVSYGTLVQSTFVLQYNILPAIRELLKKGALQIKALEMVTICINRSEENVQKVLEANIADSVLELLKSDEIEVRKQSIIFFRILVQRGSWLQIQYVLYKRLMPLLCSILNYCSVNLILKMTMITIGFYIEAARANVGALKVILKDAEVIQDRINILKNLPNIFDIQFEALNLSHKILASRSCLDEMIQNS